MEMTIERTIEISDIRLGKYYPATENGPAEGGGVEEYQAHWVDVIKHINGNVLLKTPLSKTELDIFGDDIATFISENYEPEIRERGCDCE